MNLVTSQIQKDIKLSSQSNIQSVFQKKPPNNISYYKVYICESPITKNMATD